MDTKGNETAQMPTHMWDENNVVYSCFDASGTLIYVGMTCRLEIRFDHHVRRTPWWSSVVRIDKEQCATRYDARKREAELIFIHRPIYNRQLNRCVFARSRVSQGG